MSRNTIMDEILFDWGFAEATREAGQPPQAPHNMSTLQAISYAMGINQALFADEMNRLIDEESVALKR